METRAQRTSRWERDARRREVLQLRARGLTFEQIGERLGCSPRTARRDLKEVRDTFGSPLSRAEFAQLVAEALGRLDALQERAWREHGGGTTTGARLRALDAVRRAEISRLSLLKELGLLERRTPETATQEQSGLKLSPEQRERLARAVIEEQLTDVAEPEPENIADDEHGGHEDSTTDISA